MKALPTLKGLQPLHEKNTAAYPILYEGVIEAIGEELTEKSERLGVEIGADEYEFSRFSFNFEDVKAVLEHPDDSTKTIVNFGLNLEVTLLDTNYEEVRDFWVKVRTGAL